MGHSFGIIETSLPVSMVNAIIQEVALNVFVMMDTIETCVTMILMSVRRSLVFMGGHVKMELMSTSVAVLLVGVGTGVKTVH